LWRDHLVSRLKGKGLCVGGEIPYLPIDPKSMTHLNVVDEYAGVKSNSQIVEDAHAMNSVADNTFDYLVTSHVIEHSPNPIRLIKELVRVVKTGGYLYNIIPHKDRIYDKDRALTTLQHLRDDFSGDVFTEDQTHLAEYACMVEKNPDLKQFHGKYPAGYPYMHYHTFDLDSVRALFEAAGLEVCHARQINENICILSRVTALSKQSGFLS
jgi:ubiquinone/menaquinone biosynthesis C-methylase UbiE